MRPGIGGGQRVRDPLGLQFTGSWQSLDVSAGNQTRLISFQEQQGLLTARPTLYPPSVSI